MAKDKNARKPSEGTKVGKKVAPKKVRQGVVKQKVGLKK